MIAAYASITIDDCFVIHGLRVKVSKKGDYYLFMPGRKQADSTYMDIALPINNGTRRMIEEKVFAAYKVFINDRKEQFLIQMKPDQFKPVIYEGSPASHPNTDAATPAPKVRYRTYRFAVLGKFFS